MEGNWHGSENACTQELKTDQANQDSTSEIVELSTARHVPLEQFRVDLVAKHDEIAPLRCQKNVFAAHRSEV